VGHFERYKIINMKLVRIGKVNQEKPAVLIDGKYFDVSEFVSDYNETFFENGGLQSLENIVKNKELKEIKLPERIGSCVARPSKIICVGLNYIDHAKETGADIPKGPILFLKAPLH